MSSTVPSRDFLARKARAQQHRCGRTPAGLASSSPGGIGTWGEEAPPPPNDLAPHFRKLSPFSPLVSHLECGRKSFPQAYAKRGSGLSFSEGEGLTQSPISFRCVQGPPRIQPRRIF